MPADSLCSSHLLSLALHAVSCASRLSRGVRTESLGSHAVLTKTDASPVTLADFGVQALVTLYLREHGPRSFRLVAEEDAEALHNDPGLLQTVTDLVNQYYPAPNNEAHTWRTTDVLDALSRGGDEGGEGSFWFLDPIDGTRGFVRGGHYAIGLGRIEAGVPTIAAVACPTLPPPGGSLGTEGILDGAAGSVDGMGAATCGLLFGASAGGAARVMSLADSEGMTSWDAPADTNWEQIMQIIAQPGEAIGESDATLKNGRRPLRVAESFAGRLCAHRFECFGGSVDSSSTDNPKAAAVQCSSPATDPPLHAVGPHGIPIEFVRLDSMAKYCLVARGEADAYVRAPLNGGKSERIWDHAGALVVLSAGGKVTDFLGNPLDFSLGRGLSANQGVLASSASASPNLHTDMLQCARAAWPCLNTPAIPDKGTSR